MKKFFVVISILLISALAINLSAILVYKNYTVRAVKSIQQGLSKKGIEFTYEDIKLRKFYAWDTHIDIINPQWKYGNQYRREVISTDILSLQIYPFTKLVTLIAPGDIVSTTEDAKNNVQHLLYQINSPLKLAVVFKSWPGSSNTVDGKDFISSILSMNYSDGGWKTYEVIKNNEQEENLLIFESKGQSSISINNISSMKEGEPTSISIEAQTPDCMYSADYPDPSIKAMADLGKITTSFSTVYSYNIVDMQKAEQGGQLDLDKNKLMPDKVSLETVTLNDIKVTTDRFSFDIRGKGQRYAYQRSLSWDVVVEVNQYSKVFSFIAGLINSSVKAVAKDYGVQLKLTDEHVASVKKIFETLPKASVADEKMKFTIVSKDEEHTIEIGGVKVEEFIDDIIKTLQDSQ